MPTNSSSEEQTGSQDAQSPTALEDVPLAADSTISETIVVEDASPVVERVTSVVAEAEEVAVAASVVAEAEEVAIVVDVAAVEEGVVAAESVASDVAVVEEGATVVDDVAVAEEVAVAASDVAVAEEVAAVVDDVAEVEEVAVAAKSVASDVAVVEETPAAKKELSEAEKFYQTPTRNVTWLYRILFGIAAIVLGVDNVTIKQLVLPAQMALLDPTNKIAAFTLISAVGGIAGVLGSPLIGAISDRTTWSWGRRRSWMLITAAGVVVGLFIMGMATSIWMVLLGEILVQFWVDGLLAVCTAIIPDQIPPAQRASTAAFVGMSPLVGGAVGIILISRLTNVLLHPDQGYYALAITSGIFVLLFLIVFREKRLPRTLVKPFQFSFSKLFSDFWVNPRTYPDFGFVWLSRCLAFFGYQVLITYLLYYLQDVIKLPRADQGVATFTSVTTAALIVAALTSGIVADRIQRLKPFVIVGALVMGVALLSIAFATTWPAFIISSIFVGIGFGMFLAVDQAIAVKVLPRASARGKDLGLINTAIFIPLIVGPLLGGFILDVFNNYTLLYAVTALLLMLAAVFILPVKSVR
ncbi:MAG TPA: MFS transporter [Ktedonobacteraceae bacterium]|nr:MFS transporter [Ktedonobacteraceae bacterium]